MSATGTSGTTVRLGVDGRVLDDRYHGIGRITYELVERLAARPGWDITLFVNHSQRSDRLDVGALTAHESVHTETFDHAVTSVSQFLRWPGALRRSGVDLVLFPYHLGAALSGRARRWTVVHDCILEQDRRFAPDARTRLLYRLLTWAVVHRNTVVTPSRASADAVRRYYRVAVPDEHVVPWGVSSWFGDASGAVTTVQGTPVPARYLLHVGARRPHKNVQQLVRVLAALGPRDHLVLVGSHDDRFPDPTADLARELGVQDRVLQFSGLSDAELSALYSGAHAFLYPSLVEGFGLPLLEAMTAGAPVVASDIPVFREVAEDAALLVPVDDTQAWVRAVHELDDPATRARLAEAGYARADAANWDRSTAALAAALAPPR
ncbi:glycosyltransferase family 4 protein [Nakamurella endophytica]|uniref:Glycosyl transferase family 1 n=1 Tax=Nakamurella endophytica TaxID=1748367 RepID=A0A917SNX1_9ACTN|nr:glycosyltransferase family 1 protein [Nakamurella endophytica]GGL91362.1 glycosyl transferase family 1 [Nakamurella endophytica]